MRVCSVVIAMLLIGSLAPMSHAEKPKGNPPCDCPLFTIDEWPPDYLYYCDYFATQCGDWTDVGYYVGTFSTPVPWQECGAHCASRTYIGPSKQYRGLATKMPLDYMPSRPVPEPVPVPPGTPTNFPGVKVNTRRNSHYVTFTHENQQRYAKVIEYRFNRKIAEGGNTAGAWESKFVALECVKPAQGQEVYDVFEFGEMKLFPGPYVKRGNIKCEIGNGELSPVLILLVAPELVKSAKK